MARTIDERETTSCDTDGCKSSISVPVNLRNAQIFVRRGGFDKFMLWLGWRQVNGKWLCPGCSGAGRLKDFK